MHAAGVAAAYNERRKKEFDWKWLTAIVLQFLLLAYGYGKLNARVDSLHDDVSQIHQDVRDLRQDLRKEK